MWLNYRDLDSYNRIVISKCDQNANSVDCEGCLRTLKVNTNSSNKISWDLSATIDRRNINYLNETYIIDVKTNLNDTLNSTAKSPQVRPFWNNVLVPSIKVLKFLKL